MDYIYEQLYVMKLACTAYSLGAHPVIRPDMPLLCDQNAGTSCHAVGATMHPHGRKIQHFAHRMPQNDGG